MLSVAQLDERIEKCLAILADNPHSQVFAALADAYRKRGELGRAFAVCKSGLKHHPDYAPANIVMAKLYLHQGMNDEAMLHLKHAEAQDGVTRASEYLEAEILLGMRDLSRARVLIDRLRVIDRANPEVKGLVAQLHSLQSPSAKPVQAAVYELSDISQEAKPDDHPEPKRTEEPHDWVAWASEIASQQHVVKAFAVSLSDSGTMPFSVLAEQGLGITGADVVTICTGMFAAIDAECRANGAGVAEEIRVEREDGEVWCRRAEGCIIGFVGRCGMSYGALRQSAIDGAARVNNRKISQ